MTIRDILTRPLPPPKRTVGSVALAMTLSVTLNVLRGQQTKKRDAELATLRRDVRRLQKLTSRPRVSDPFLRDIEVKALESMHTAVVTGQKLDTLVAELRARGHITVASNTEVPTTHTARRTRPPGEH